MSEEMQDLLGKYFSGEATPDEVLAIEQWVAAGEENRQEFALLERMWNRSGDQEPVLFDTEKAWQTVHQRLHPSLPVATSHRFMKRALIGIAASVLLVLSIWWWINGKTAMQTVTASADVQEVLLEDGTKVYLRKGASLTYPEDFASGSRDVSMQGQAFFEVTPNPSRPFIITADQTVVQVVGTSFSVNTHDEQVELIVKTGRVNFAPVDNPGKRVMVSAGERALFTNGSIDKIANTDSHFDAWQTRRLDFNNTPLEDVFRALNDYYNVNIRLKPGQSEELLTIGVTNDFVNQPLESVLKEIEMITSLRFSKLGETEYEVSKE